MIRSYFNASLDILLRRRPRVSDVEKDTVDLHVFPNKNQPEVPRPRLGLEDLPNEMLVDFIFIYLSVMDVLRLRQTNKYFYDLTHHTVVWKRLLQWANVPIPPVPPTSRHSLPNISGLEAERLCVRAVSLQRMWTSPNPRLVDAWVFGASHCVLSMTAVPGGQYVVASVADKYGDYYTNYALLIFAMDHPSGGAYPIVKFRTETKAFHITARYMTIRNSRVLAIAYVRMDQGSRRERENPNPRVNVNMFCGDYEIDAPVPIKYECVALEAPLEALELLTDPRLIPGSPEWMSYAEALPKPVRRLVTIRTSSQLMRPDLDELHGKPYLAVIKKPNKIMFKNLEGGDSSTLACALPALHVPNPNLKDKILAIRIIPIENGVLVVRRVDGFAQAPNTRTFVEFYDALSSSLKTPDNGLREWTHHCYDRERLPEFDYVDCTVSGHGIPTQLDDSVLPSLYSAIDSMIPHPITLFLRTRDEEGLHRWTLFPERDEQWLQPPPDCTPAQMAHMRKYGTWRYHLDHIHETIRPAGTYGDLVTHRALPGSQRSIIYTVPRHDITDAPPILRFGRQYCPYSQSLATASPLFTLYPDSGVHYSESTHAWFDVPEWVDLHNVQTMAWDETIGRLFLALKDSDEVIVLDFAQTPRMTWYEQRAGAPIPISILPNPNKILVPLPERKASPVADVNWQEVYPEPYELRDDLEQMAQEIDDYLVVHSH